MKAIDSVCKICRRYRTKLFLKGERCNSPKCSVTRRTYGPGLHGQARKRLTEYAQQLAEKQKAKAIYGIREKQFKNYYMKAAQSKTNTGEKLIQFLETRLDNAIYRLGFASSRTKARQIIKHGHILLNGKKVDIPSYQLKTKDIIELKDKKTQILKTDIPAWLNLDKKTTKAEVLKLPQKNEIPLNFSYELIIEFYSR